MTYKSRHIFRLYKTVFHKFSTACNRLQGSFELVRNICRKFSPHSLGVCLLRYVKRKKNSSHNIIFIFDTAYFKLILTLVMNCLYFTMSVRKSLVDGINHIVLSVYCDEFISDTIFVCAKKRHCRRVYA